LHTSQILRRREDSKESSQELSKKIKTEKREIRKALHLKREAKGC
jgi:hypothetical protein